MCGVQLGLDNDEQRVGADIIKRALPYSLKLIARNAGVNGSVVVQKVLDSGNLNVGYNAETGVYEDLLKAGIIDPAKVGPPPGPCLTAHGRLAVGLGSGPRACR